MHLRSSQVLKENKSDNIKLFVNSWTDADTCYHALNENFLIILAKCYQHFGINIGPQEIYYKYKFFKLFWGYPNSTFKLYLPAHKIDISRDKKARLFVPNDYKNPQCWWVFQEK